MAKISHAYDLSGGYSFNDEPGVHHGKIIYLDNGLVMGTVQDDNSGTNQWNIEKLVLGRHNPVDNSLYLLKLSPARNGLAPVLWCLQGEDAGENSLSSIYQGFFQFGYEFICPPAQELQQIINFEKPNFNELKDQIDPQVLELVYFTEKMIDLVKHSGAEMNQKGYFNFLPSRVLSL